MIGRTLCLSALLVRGTLESAISLANGPGEAQRFHALAQRLNRWLNEQDFTAQFTEDELQALSGRPGGWTDAQHQAQGERVEGVGMLRWALSLEETVPGYEEPFAFPDLSALLGWPAEAFTATDDEPFASFPYNGTDLLLGLAALRPLPSVLAQRGAADCWQWRVSMAFHQRAHPTPPPGHDYNMLIGIAAEEAHAAGAICRPLMNDFPVQGQPFAMIPPELQDRCGQIAAWRHLALDWLCGYASAWDAQPLGNAA